MQTSYNFNFGEGYFLAAEDSQVQAKRLKHFFDVNNIRSEIYNNGIDAYKAALDKPPLLIISDILMPGMDGYEFCTKIKTHNELKDIPVILLTSLSDPLDIIKGLQAGADNFITKPYDEQYLLSRINYLIANRDMRRSGGGDMVIEIVFHGQKFQINSDKKQILDLLLSVYEAAILRNEDLIKAQHQLQVLNENLLAANQELEAFAHTVSHDLRSPLVGVIGFSELMIEDFEEKPLNETAKSHLQYILRSARNMAQLIEDLLRYSRSGTAEIEAKPIDLSLMAREVMFEIQERNPERKVNVIIQEGLTAFADPLLMRMALDNLLGNAWKYSGKVDKPEILFGKTTEGFSEFGKSVFFVKDNGAGFDNSKADKLFSPFIRFHTNQEFQGTGVGLSTVKRIIERHGGQIWAESEPDKGAIFYFSLGDE
ncbi:MAG: response regulator [Ignavibacteriae bacterium]|nr:response regulator [Ignavibacteriota bacterium]